MCSTLSIDSSRNKGSVCELNLLSVMILRAFFCNVNIRLHLKPQAVMQKYICGKIKELHIRLRICCGIDFFILFMMPIVFVILFDMLVMCQFQSTSMLLLFTAAVYPQLKSMLHLYSCNTHHESFGMREVMAGKITAATGTNHFNAH